MTDLLGEALARWEGWEMGDPYDPGTLDQLLIGIVVAVLDALTVTAEPCQRCAGKGVIHTEPNDPGFPCPECQ